MSSECPQSTAPRMGLCASHRKQKNKVFLSQIMSRSKINPLQGRNESFLGCSKRISPTRSQIASGRKPSQPLPAHWDKCGNIPINHLSEILLPGGTVLLFCVLGIRFHTSTSVDYDQICQEDTFERQAGLKCTTSLLFVNAITDKGQHLTTLPTAQAVHISPCPCSCLCPGFATHSSSPKQGLFDLSKYGPLGISVWLDPYYS